MGLSLALDVRELSYTYPSGHVALSSLSFSICHGERVGLVGPNGSGKTTLLLCVGGILGVREGSIQVAGIDPARRDQRRQLPTKVGFVFSDSDDQLFCASVGEDVAFGPLNLGLPATQVRERVTEALTRVGMAGSEARVPFQLSGGEKRRVALAGVLA